MTLSIVGIYGTQIPTTQVPGGGRELRGIFQQDFEDRFGLRLVVDVKTPVLEPKRHQASYVETKLLDRRFVERDKYFHGRYYNNHGCRYGVEKLESDGKIMEKAWIVHETQFTLVTEV